MASAETYNWLKQLSPAVLQWDQVPLYGASPNFPWEELSSKLAQLFGLKSIRISHQETDWRNPEDFTTGFGGEPLLFQVGISNLEGILVFVLSKSDLTTFMEALLGRKPDDFIGLDPDFFQGFYRYLVSQVLFTISSLPFGKNLGLGLISPPALPTEPSLCLEIEMALGDKLAKGRLIISPEALASWKGRWADRSLTTALNSPLADKLQVPVHLEIGRTRLLKSDWAQVSPGDFIMLDHCSYDPEAEKGRVMLTIKGIPMFRAKLKQGAIKILEFPNFHEANQFAYQEAAPMNHDEDASDTLGEFEDEEEEQPTLGTEEETLPEEEASDLGEEALEEEEEGEEKEEPAAAAPPPSAAIVPKEKKISPADIALDIVIEVGRIQMSMQKLLELEPGNTLDLNIHPENGVDLVVNGRRIGKAELLRIGENLGVRILDIG